MNTKKLAMILTSLSFFFPLCAFAEEGDTEMLTGDPKSACEAIMCLSSPGSRPSECQPSLHRFYSIKFKHGRDTVTARRNFLRKCPASNEPEISNLINTLVR